MTKPVRFRLSRKKGYDLQAYSRAINGRSAVKVSRPGPFGNPFKVGVDGTAAECVRLYRLLLGGNVCLSTNADPDYQVKSRCIVIDRLKELRGRNLACWCKRNQPCHADVLLELANKDVP